MACGRASSPVGRAAFKAVGALDRCPVGSTPTSSAKVHAASSVTCCDPQGFGYPPQRAAGGARHPCPRAGRLDQECYRVALQNTCQFHMLL